MNITYIKNWLKENLTPDRYEHSLATAKTAMELAKMFNVDEGKAYVAGLLHDCAKCKTEREMIDLMQDKIREMNPDEVKNAKILHAPVGAYLAREGFGVKDADILSSIRWHTLGKTDMNTFEMVVFLADKIEPSNRDKDFRQKVLTVLNADRTENGLKQAIFMCYARTIKSLVERKLPIMTMTVDTYNELLNCIKF